MADQHTIPGVDGLSVAYYQAVNELLPQASPIGAYCMGAVTVMAIADGLEPDHQLLYAASRLVRVGAADVVYSEWFLGRIRAAQRSRS